MKKSLAFFLAAFLTVGLVYGCAKKADTHKSVDQIRQEVQSLSVQDLQAYAKAYQSAVDKQKAEAEKIAEELKKIPFTQMLGDESKSIKERLEKVQSQVSALAERYQVYIDKLREKGVNA